MSFGSIKSGFITLLVVICAIICVKAWKDGKWIEIISTVAGGALLWALLTGKDLFGIAWKFITGILSVFGIKG